MKTLKYRILAVYTLVFCNIAYADGILTINPYVSSNITYDDNLFRLSSTEKAQNILGTNTSSDVLKRVEAGADVSISLGRQLFALTSSFSQSMYETFSYLDNTGSSNRLAWNWVVGSDFFGELGANQITAILGFNELGNTNKNLQTTTSQFASANWRIHPEWIVFANTNQSDVKSEETVFTGIQSTNSSYQTGVRYIGENGNSISLSYLLSETDFPSSNSFIFGDSTQQKSIQLNAFWVPTIKTRLNLSLSTINVGYERFTQRDVSGLNKRLNLSYALSGKLNFNVSGYQEISAVNDIVSTFIETKGVVISPDWGISSKTSIRGSLGYEIRNFLGDAGFVTNSTVARNDESTTASLALTYLPTDKSLVQLQYQGENRVSNINAAGYQFNNLSAFFRYNF